jgi:hypothetical protein
MAASDISTQTVVDKVKPVTRAFNENGPAPGTSKANEAFICFTTPPPAVPVNAAPLVGAVPVP